MSDLVILDKSEGGVALVTFNRPEVLNAFNTALQTEALAVLDECRDDPAVRVVILCGAGRAFSAGFDLGAGDAAERADRVEAWKFDHDEAYRFVTSFWRLPKPVIAATHGYCLGGGCEVAMMCDLTIAAETCRFGEPEIRLGYGSTASMLLPFLVPVKIARELLYLGTLIDATRAYEVGLVNAVVPEAGLHEEAFRQARVLSLISPKALRLAKEAVNFALESAGSMHALRHNQSLAAILAGVEDSEDAAFQRVVGERGISEALRWRRQQFDELE